MSMPYQNADQQLRRLTPRGVATMRDLNERDEAKIGDLRTARADLMSEVASIDEVMADLRETIDRRQAKMRGDTISLLPTDVRVAPQADERAHADMFTGPATQVMNPVEPDPPAGYCHHCGQSVWRTSITPASPKGFQHSFGATCDPNDPDSKVAEIVEEVPS